MENCLFIFTNEYGGGEERITFRKGRSKKYEEISVRAFEPTFFKFKAPAYILRINFNTYEQGCGSGFGRIRVSWSDPV